MKASKLVEYGGNTIVIGAVLCAFPVMFWAEACYAVGAAMRKRGW